MSPSAKSIREDRDLTDQEAALVRWLLEHGTKEAAAFLPQLNRARIFSRCPCGCASVDFAIDGRRPSQFSMRVLSDYQWRSAEGHLFGAFVFEQDDLLAGLDLWSIDGQATPTSLPPVEALAPLGARQEV